MPFYPLKEKTPAGAAVKEIVTSAWASKEDLAEEERRDSGSGSGRATTTTTTSWSEDEVPLKGIRVKNVVEVATREDVTGGSLSPV
ncbi:MAG: hypothetical protein Q9161_004049 [Pseudevernia consocians]